MGVKETTAQHRKEMFTKLRDAMASGKLDWSQPWNTPVAPVNAVTKKKYRGINRAVLWVGDNDDPRWCTFRQAKARNWSIKKGSKAEYVLFWKMMRGSDKVSSETGEVLEMGKFFPLRRYSPVFNGKDIDGIPEWNAAEFKRDPLKIDVCELIINNCGVPIKYDGDSAFYSPLTDKIVCPRPEWFRSDEHFYATVLHEIAHSTGHPKRLNRNMSGSFGGKRYAFEELVAEMASAFVMSDLNLYDLDNEIMQEHVQKHSAYLQSWLRGTENDMEVLEKAFSLANKASNMILSYAGVEIDPADDEPVEDELAAAGGD